MAKLQYIAERSQGMKPSDILILIIESCNKMKANILQTFVSSCTLLALCSGAPITNSSDGGDADAAANRCVCSICRSHWTMMPLFLRPWTNV